MKDGTEDIDDDYFIYEWPDEFGNGQRINEYRSLSKEEKVNYLKEYEKNKIEILLEYIENLKHKQNLENKKS